MHIPIVKVKMWILIDSKVCTMWGLFKGFGVMINMKHVVFIGIGITTCSIGIVTPLVCMMYSCHYTLAGIGKVKVKVNKIRNH